MTETILEEQEEVLVPDSHGEICPSVGPRYSPEAHEGTETAGTGELNQEAGVRESDKLPEVVVPNVTLQRGSNLVFKRRMELSKVVQALKMLRDEVREDLIKEGVLEEAWVGLKRPKRLSAQGVSAAVAAFSSPQGKSKKFKTKSAEGRKVTCSPLGPQEVLGPAARLEEVVPRRRGTGHLLRRSGVSLVRRCRRREGGGPRGRGDTRREAGGAAQQRAHYRQSAWWAGGKTSPIAARQRGST
ncbi:hypothetical protein NDU88_006819 [Pleurodeles waltl]|uniref:Uncharacterized protein n=1 Tax=Pleurodeles waltl TaxID=8319 RepID=A0AAV7NUL9_PLEWA|nr:hypothetical protein NDU88_006819 [Pleurodeles waltl]